MVTEASCCPNSLGVLGTIPDAGEGDPLAPNASLCIQILSAKNSPSLGFP